MYKITEKTIKESLKPFDLVSYKNKCIGIIQEVDFNYSQELSTNQIRYTVHWIIGHSHFAWYENKELEKICNIFEETAKMTCNVSNKNKDHIRTLFNKWS